MPDDNQINLQSGGGHHPSKAGESPSLPEPEFHPVLVDSPIAPVSLFRQILERLREPKTTVPKKYYPTVEGTPTGSPSIPGPEYHATFVDSPIAVVSLYRQILERLREPKTTIPKNYYPTAEGTPTGSPPMPGPEYHATFVDSPIAPVSLFRQILERLREPKVKVPKGYYRRKGTPPVKETGLEPLDFTNQLGLPFDRPITSIPSTLEPFDAPASWEGHHLLVELDPEVIKWRRRTMFLLSVMLHVLLVLIIVFSPDLLRRGRRMVGLPVQVAPKKEYSYLFLPPEVLRRLREPPPENAPLSDRNRRAQGRSPVIDPNGLHMPYSLGNTKVPEIAGGKPPAAAPTPPPAGATLRPPASRPISHRIKQRPTTTGAYGLKTSNLVGEAEVPAWIYPASLPDRLSSSRCSPQRAAGGMRALEAGAVQATEMEAGSFKTSSRIFQRKGLLSSPTPSAWTSVPTSHASSS